VIDLGLPFNSCMCETDTGINKVLIYKIRREYLQPVSETTRAALSYEKPRIYMDPPGDRFDAHNRIISLRCHCILNPVKEFPGGHRWLLTQMLHVALEFGRGQVRVDPIILKIPSTP